MSLKPETTNFNLRVPSDIHKAWKSTAALKNETMQKYCLVALKLRIKQDINKEIDNVSGSRL